MIAIVTHEMEKQHCCKNIGPPPHISGKESFQTSTPLLTEFNMCCAILCRAVAAAIDVLAAHFSCGLNFREGSVSTLIRGLPCLAPTLVGH